ncbi:hypothetical protein JHK82_048055 [Glycine max]|nr:hypothetical protein JHK82_048055 [Glycine max]
MLKRIIHHCMIYLINVRIEIQDIIEDTLHRPVKTEIEALKEELEKAKDYDDKLSKKETFIE